MPLLLVNPGVPVSTAEVFAGWDGVDQGPMPINSPLITAKEGRNDLEAPACLLVPEIVEVLALLAGAAGLFASRMSGSGATCFALFEREEDRDAAANAVAQQRPDWWLLATRLR
jgi:4-diphosphocytidyl-2-C-methyl-D-erythritol kinase